MPFYFYRVNLNENGEILRSRLNFFKIKIFTIIILLFESITYMVGLFPLVIFKIFMNKYESLQLIDNSLSIQKPHLGKVWYEKRKFITFKEFKFIIEQFFEEK